MKDHILSVTDIPRPATVGCENCEELELVKI